MKTAIIGLFFFICITLNLKAESDSETIHNYLLMVADGKVSEVKAQLPDLMVNYPNDPGVQFLLGVCIEDAYKAVEIYKKVINEFPQSEWADDAYWRLVQFYAILGDTDKARMELDKFRTNYQSSPYLQAATDVVRSAVGLAKYRNPNANLAPLNTSNSAPKVAVENRKQETKKEEHNQKTEKSNEVAKSLIEEQIKKTSTEEVNSAEEIAVSKPEKEVKAKDVKAEIEEKEEEVSEGKSGMYGLQVGVFATKDAAEVEMKKFLKQRMRTEIKEKNKNNEKQFAVIIGNYSSRESAEAAKIIVQQQCNCSPIVFEK